jgi:ADP-ribosylglycohydrolase
MYMQPFPVLLMLASIVAQHCKKMSTTPSKIDKSRIQASLYGMLVGDALAVPGHWYYSPAKLRQEYGPEGITHMIAPHSIHAESMVQGMSYAGTIDIMHDKRQYYAGNQVTSTTKLTEEEIAARRDDHGNFVGATADNRVHYHASLKAGQNTVNACIARLLMRYVAKTNAPHRADNYQPDEFLQAFYKYMTTPPKKDKVDQVDFHNDVYMDVYLRGFFTKASQGKELKDCALSQRDTWSIGSLDGVVMSIPMIAAYAYEPESYVMGRVVEHHMLTHKSVTVTATLYVLVPLLLELYQGADLREALDRAMLKMRPPKITGREMSDSYKAHHGPGNIPKKEKWNQHMILEEEETTKDLVHRLLQTENDEDVAGWGDRPNSRLATACYCEQGFTVVLYLAYKYGPSDPRKALIQNVNLGGHSTARGAILGAILGAAHGGAGPGSIPFYGDLAAHDTVVKEIDALVATV